MDFHYFMTTQVRKETLPSIAFVRELEMGIKGSFK